MFGDSGPLVDHGIGRQARVEADLSIQRMADAPILEIDTKLPEPERLVLRFDPDGVADMLPPSIEEVWDGGGIADEPAATSAPARAWRRRGRWRQVAACSPCWRLVARPPHWLPAQAPHLTRTSAAAAIIQIACPAKTKISCGGQTSCGTMRWATLGATEPRGCCIPTPAWCVCCVHVDSTRPTERPIAASRG